MSWIHIRRDTKFVKIQITRTPFNSDCSYWALRNSKYSAYPLQISKLYKSQDGICLMCNHHFDTLSKLEVDHAVFRALGGKDAHSNLQLLRESWDLKKTAADKLEI